MFLSLRHRISSQCRELSSVIRSCNRSPFSTTTSSQFIASHHRHLPPRSDGKLLMHKKWDDHVHHFDYSHQLSVARHFTKAPPVWDYDEHGPSSWIKAFPDGCGQHQSPINIDTSAPYVKYDIDLDAIEVDYERCKATTIWNSGHSFQVNFSLDSPATLTRGPLREKYQLVQFHGHWGPSPNVHGSEHTINSRSFPAELHFVHFNKQKYKTIKEAIHHEDGLAVIAVFLKVHPKEKPHREVQQLIADIKDIDYNDHEESLHFSIHPRELMPENLEHYFTYPGSLTTPPLSQCITWLVLSDPLLVSSEQLTHFHELHRPRDKRPIDHNYRPVQPVHDRIVRASFPNYNDHTIDGPIKD